MVAKDVFFTEPFVIEPIKGREAYKEDIQGLFSYISDVKFELLSLIVEGNQAAFDWNTREYKVVQDLAKILIRLQLTKK